MWTISLLKRNAWNSLKNYYWTAFAVCFLGAIIMGAVGGSGTFIQSSPSASAPVLGMLLEDGGLSYSDSSDSLGFIGFAAFMTMYFVILLVAIAVSMVIYAFLGNPIEVGQCSFFNKARNGNVEFSHMFDGFGNGRYMANVKVMFWRMLYTFLWSMLFVIPGIVKSLEYTLIPYLLTENATLSKERAFEISKRTMNGEKANLFLLELSFIGWYLLGILTCGIGIYFVLPYQQATMAEFYACMRAKAIAQGITTEEELSGIIA